jgi:hypothetical protein
MNIQHKVFSGLRARTPLAAAVTLALAAAAPAHAFEFGRGELTGGLDTSISYGVSIRTQDPATNLIGKAAFNPALAAQVAALNAQGRFLDAQALQIAAPGAFSVNGDDGDRNYGDAGEIFANTAKITSELSLKYGQWGAFVRGSYFYDFENANKDVLSKRAKERVGEDARLLDAFIYRDFTFGEGGTGTARVGRQVVSWGESTFIQGGINVINPVDVSRLRVAGAELKEAFLPIDMIFTSFSFNENLSLEALYMLEFEQIEVDPPGSFFSTNDFAGDGGGFAMLGFGTAPQPVNNPDLFSSVCQSGPGGFALSDTGLPPALVGVGCGAAFARAPNRNAKDSGQWGAALKYYSPELGDTEFGLYYLRYHSRLPIISGTAVTSSLTSSGRVIIEYPEDINLFGFSWNTTILDGWAFQGELSYRDNLPIQIDDVEILFAGLSPLNAVLPQPALRFSSQLGNFGLGEFISGYERHEVSQLQATFTKLYQQVLGADQTAVVVEIGGTNFWDLPSKDVLRFNGDGTHTGGGPDISSGSLRNPQTQVNGFPDSFSWGYRTAVRSEYNSLFGSAITFAPRVAFNHDVNGTTPGPGGNFVEGRKSLTLGTEFIYLNQWSFDASYTSFFGAGDRNLIRDRDFVSFSVRYSF